MRELTQSVQIVGGIRDGKKLWPLGRETGERPVCPRISSGFPPLSRLLSVLHQASGTTIDGASYTYDNAGNRTSKTNDLNRITENYTYDALYELTQVTQGGSTTESYSYDLVGNRLSSLGVLPTTTIRQTS